MNSTVPPISAQLPSYEQLAIAYVLMAQRIANNDPTVMGYQVIAGLQIAQKKSEIAFQAMECLSSSYAISVERGSAP